MRYLLCIFACLLSLCSSSDLLAKTKQVKIGTFKIDGTTSKGSLILEDGNIYRPLTNQEGAATWQLGDSILVKRGKRANRFVLVNATRTGDYLKAKIISKSLK